MKIKKQKLDDMTRCYSCTELMIDGELHVLFAEEEKAGKCYEFYGANFENKRTVWESGGGTMSIVPIPNSNGEFLATIGFNRGFDAAHSKIVWCKLEDGCWVCHDFVEVPYLHRFDILETQDKTYLVGGVLCEEKKDREDWSSAGKVIFAEMPADYTQEPKFESFDDEIHKNHGYFKARYKGEESCFFSGEQGIFRLHENQGSLQLDQIFYGEVSDMAILDIDNDGIEEMLVFAPFHGNDIQIYKEKNGSFVSVYQYEQPAEFVHAIDAGQVLGKKSFVFGIRKANKELVVVQYNHETNSYEEHIVDREVGTANTKIVNCKEHDLLLAANHTINEAAVYYISE